jgi:hypothetical protein
VTAHNAQLLQASHCMFNADINTCICLTISLKSHLSKYYCLYAQLEMYLYLICMSGFLKFCKNDSSV